MSRVFLVGWLLAVSEIGCGGATTSRPESGSQEAGAGSGAGLDPKAEATNGASSAAAQVGGSDAPVSCACVPAKLGWWRAGAGPRRSESHVSGCNVFTFSKLSSPSSSCLSTLEGCGEQFGVDDLNRALANADVQAALARSPTIVGIDPRRFGGEVDHIEVNDKIIEIGNPCSNDPACQIPVGINDLDNLLGHIELFEPQRGACIVN